MFRIFANLCVPLHCCVHVKYHSPPLLSFISPYPGCSILTPTNKPVTMVTVTNTVHPVLKQHQRSFYFNLCRLKNLPKKLSENAFSTCAFNS